MSLVQVVTEETVPGASLNLLTVISVDRGPWILSFGDWILNCTSLKLRARNYDVCRKEWRCITGAPNEK